MIWTYVAAEKLLIRYNRALEQSPMENQPETPEKKSNKLAVWKIILLVVFYPIGIGYLLYKMWKNQMWSKPARIIITAIVVFIFIGAFSSSNSRSKNQARLADSTQTNTTTSNTETAKPTDTPKPTEKKKHPIKVSIDGKIEPPIAQVGDKVAITITVQNNDKEQTVDGIRLLSTNKDYLEKALIVVNAVNGEKSFGGAYEWNTPIMRIPPGEKRNLVIVAQANEPGSYETQFLIKSSDFNTQFDLPADGEELKAKLIVLH